MEERYPIYEKILEKQDKIITRMENLEVRTKEIQEGIKRNNYSNKIDKWNDKKIVRDTNEN